MKATIAKGMAKGFAKEFNMIKESEEKIEKEIRGIFDDVENAVGVGAIDADLIRKVRKDVGDFLAKKKKKQEENILIIDNNWCEKIAKEFAEEFNLNEQNVYNCFKEAIGEGGIVDIEEVKGKLRASLGQEQNKRKEQKKGFYITENDTTVDSFIENTLLQNNPKYEKEAEKVIGYKGIFKRLRGHGMTQVPQIAPPCGRVWCNCVKCFNNKLSRVKRYEIFMGCLPK